MLRLGLCCKFSAQPIRFKTATTKGLGRLTPKAALGRLSALCRDNAYALLAAIDYCAANGMGSFRINSEMMPLYTHPQYGYKLAELPQAQEIGDTLAQCRKVAQKKNIRLTFHPDQFVLLNSPKSQVVRASLEELQYQAELAALVGADVINIHAGGAYGDKAAALARLAAAVEALPQNIRKYLTLENDDRVYTPKDLLPFCLHHKIPFVYDLHHHRCLPDGLSIEEVTKEAIKSWNREPLFHISSPKNGWKGKDIRYHADYIDKDDFPACWSNLDVTVEVEAKAKELAVKQLLVQLAAK